MQQKTFHFTGQDFPSCLNAIKETAFFGTPEDTLLIVQENSPALAEVESHVKAYAEAFPGYSVVGETMLGPLDGYGPAPTGVDVLLLHFETSHFTLLHYSLDQMSEEEAGKAFAEDLKKVDFPKAALYFSSGMADKPDHFFSELQIKDFPIVGAPAGPHSYFQAGDDRVFFSGDVLPHDIVMVVLGGEDLSVKAGSSFGWQPFGRHFEVTSGDGKGNVFAINGDVPLKIYSRYIHVESDSPSYYEFCAFPIVEGEGSSLTSRIPLVLEGGAFHFGTDMPVGTKFSLAYAKEKDLLEESLELANDLSAFGPDALYGFVCRNRRVFLGKDLSERENGYFELAFPEVLYGFGFGEVLWNNGKGGYRNSSIVFLALREGAPKRAPRSVVDPGLASAASPNPDLPLRLVSFLEETTKDLQEMARHDSLTGLLNRQGLEEWLKMKQSEGVEEITAFMFDIDNFKQINDTYGHDVGDEVLKKVAAAVKAKWFGHDAASRWGGDEFLCATDFLSSDKVYKIADEARHAVDSAFGPSGLRVTISGGVASMKRGESFEDLYKKVDRAMYHSKHSGGDQVTLYSDVYEKELSHRGKAHRFSLSLQSAYENSSFPLMICQKVDGRVCAILVSSGLAEMVGMGKDELLVYCNNGSYSSVHPEDAANCATTFRSILDRDSVSYSFRFRINGEYHPLLMWSHKEKASNGAELAFVQFLDLTKNEAMMEATDGANLLRQRQDLSQDPVTGIPSLSYFHAFAPGARKDILDSHLSPVYLMVDVVGMLSYNQRFGYPAGDKLLKSVASILVASFPKDLVCRIAEDRFMILTSRRDAESKILEINEKVKKAAKEKSSAIRMGEYVAFDAEESIDSCLDKAKLALSKLRLEKGSFFLRYDKEAFHANEVAAYILSHFGQALKEGWIKAYFQPTFDAKDGKILGYAVSPRWEDPEKGTLLPEAFFPALEKSGLAEELDLELLEQSCRKLKQWMKRGYKAEPISLPVSETSLLSSDLAKKVRSVLERFGVSAKMVCIEVKEENLLSVPEQAKKTLSALRKQGHPVSLSNCFSRFASLSVLRDFRFDAVKLDAPYFREFVDPKRREAIASMIVASVSKLNCTAIGSMIDSEVGVEFFRRAGCAALSGDFLAKPMPYAELFRYLKKKGSNSEK